MNEKREKKDKVYKFVQLLYSIKLNAATAVWTKESNDFSITNE